MKSSTRTQEIKKSHVQIAMKLMATLMLTRGQTLFWKQRELSTSACQLIKYKDKLTEWLCRHEI